MMANEPATPPMSRDGSVSGKIKPDLTLDLSDLPPLSTPAPPSNTLLITGLHDQQIFTPAALSHLRELIDTHTSNDIFSFSPIRSFRRIIATFYNIESAVKIRALLDCEYLFTSRVRIYFGEPTPTSSHNDASKHLAAPRSDKLFFISPPPSPPHGWEVRDEEPPNKDVHAEDLAQALQRLSAKEESVNRTGAAHSRDPLASTGRKRSGSTIVFDPQESGNDPDLPAIAVEDTTESPEPMTPDESPRSTAPMPKTERPPVDVAMHH